MESKDPQNAPVEKAAQAAQRPAEQPAPAPSTAPAPAVAPAPASLVPESDAPKIAAFTHLHDYLTYVRDIGASDLHINVASPPVIRKYGRLVPLPRQPFTAAETEALLFKILTDEQRKRIHGDAVLALDFRYNVPDQGRYRSCIVKQRIGWDGSFRVVQSRVPSFKELGLPEQLQRLTEFNQGLVLVTGPNGCGKSTTLAAMVELVNQHREEHIITIEDPVEFNFVPAKSHINQREVGSHTKSFSLAMEILLNTPAVGNLIRERKLFQIPSIIQTSRQQGMMLLDNSLTDLVNRGVIDGSEAYYAADKKEPFLKWAPRIDGIALEA